MRIPTALRSFQPVPAALLAACVLIGSAGAREQPATDEGAADSPAEVLCMALPRIAVSDGAPVVSAFSETLREQLAAFVSGPLLEPRPMTARLPVQIRAEAAQEGCRYLLNLTFTHHPQSKIGRRTAETAITVGGAAASLGAVSSSASGALGAASTISGLFGRSESSGSSGSGLYPLGKNDRVALEYTLEPVSKQKPAAAHSGKFEGKAGKDNDPQVEAIVEKTANGIVDALMADQQAPQ